MVAAVTDAAEHRFRRFAETLANVVLGDQAARGRALGAKGKGFTTNALRQFVTTLQPGALVGDEVVIERLVLYALGESFRAWNQCPGLNTGQSAKPGQLYLVVAER